ncbi:MAG: hypothetical protein HZB65_02040 [Candidatus Aenigmarchaeota archaeon]|nr:hypothetical protein [Candidatus Aenigmarchaeota archaeon]
MNSKLFAMFIMISIIFLAGMAFAVTYSDYDYGTQYSDYSSSYYDYSIDARTPYYSVYYRSGYYPYSYYSYGYRSPSYYTYYDRYSGYYQSSGYYGSGSYNSYSTYPSYSYLSGASYGGIADYQYNNPILSSGDGAVYCQEPYGYNGDTRTMGINGKGEFRCSNGNWVLVREISEPAQAIKKSTLSKKEYYSG